MFIPCYVNKELTNRMFGRGSYLCVRFTWELYLIENSLMPNV